MKSYYVNKNAQPNGDHEVHEGSCEHMPAPHNCEYLGVFSDCHGAVRRAKERYPTADGCYYCSRPCHTR